MIKVNEGLFIAEGSLPVLLADLTCAVHGIYHEALLPAMPEEKALETIQMAFDMGTKPDDEEEPEELEKDEVLERVTDALHDLISTLRCAAKDVKRKDEK